MKVLLICGSVIPNGGTERATSNLVKILDMNPLIQSEIVSIFSNEKQVPSFEFNCRITHLNEMPFASGIIKRLKWYRKIIRELKDAVKDTAPDVIIGIGHNISIMLPFIATSGIRTFAAEHIEFSTIPAFNRQLIKLIYPKLTGVIVLTKRAQNEMKCLNKNIVIIPNSIPFNTKNTSSLNNSSLIMVGRLSKEKGYERIIPIAKKLKESLPNLRINIFGDGSERSFIENLIKEAELQDYVILKGLDPNIELRYPENDILLMTSYTEALPMVIIEANSAGLPVIAYENSGVNSTIVEGVNGYIVKDNDVNDFVNKVKDLLKNRDKISRLSQSAIKNTQQYSESEIARKWDELLLG